MYSRYINLFLMIFLFTAGCGMRESIGSMENNIQTEPTASGERRSQISETIQLPDPVVSGSVTLEETMDKRRSVRDFSDIQLTWEETGQLLWAAQGITDPAGFRTAPSAGARYPLEVYVVTSQAVYHYEPNGHRLRVHIEGDVKRALHTASLRQDSIINAPSIFVISAVYERTQARYGEERTPRYVHMEVGHAGQNLLLQAVALDLGAVIIGAFYDTKVKETLSLPDDQEPLYLIPVGHPR
jgi:SagB-type dehydrogenase family enzyme